MAEQHGKALVPQIRFAGFTDPWEQRKLGELGFAQSGIGFPDAEQGGSEGIPFFKVSDMNTPGNERELVISNNYVTADQIARMSWHPICQVPAIFFAKVGAAVLLNRKRLVNELFLLDNNTMAFSMDPNRLDSQFGQSLFERIDLTSLVQVGALPSYNASDVEDMTVSLPDHMDEQRQIGRYLARLDSLITLHQRKYDKLCVLKKSMLDKMFPKGGSLYPEIRFSGFTDPWEQRKLEDYVVVSTAKNVDGRFNKEDVLSVSGEYGIVNQIAFQGRSFAGSSVLNYGIVNTGDIVYTKSPLNSNPYGIIKVNKGIPGIVSTLYAVYRPQDNVHTNFIQVYFEQHERMNNYMHPLVNKGAKNDMKVTAENALKGVVTFPSREEQVIISEFFDRLDSLITLHQRKLELLRNIKKSMLDKMFV